jgi:predicted enzyme related to lactoylglutathione lyase
VADLNLVVLYVDNAQVSSAFYQALLGQPVSQSSPQFVVLPLGKGTMLGLWQRDNVAPPVAAEAGGSEIALTVANVDAVRDTYEAWKARDVRIAQPPTAMAFGHTFVGLDPDGHRLRVFAPAG